MHDCRFDGFTQRQKRRIATKAKTLGIGIGLAAGGCHLNRDVATLIEGSGLRIRNLERFCLPGEGKHIGYTFRGIATPTTSGGSA
jgi:hypothetical protein